MLPKIDVSDFPLVHIVYGPEMAYEEITQYGQQLHALFKERGPLYTIIDISQVKMMEATAKHRNLLSAEMDRLAAQGVFKAEIVIATNPVMRGMVRAYEWLRGNKSYPFVCVKDLALARQEMAKYLP